VSKLVYPTQAAVIAARRLRACCCCFRAAASHQNTRATPHKLLAASGPPVTLSPIRQSYGLGDNSVENGVKTGSQLVGIFPLAHAGSAGGLLPVAASCRELGAPSQALTHPQTPFALPAAGAVYAGPGREGSRAGAAVPIRRPAAVPSIRAAGAAQQQARKQAPLLAVEGACETVRQKPVRGRGHARHAPPVGRID